MNWNLEWYYFGDVVTLAAEGGDACAASAASYDGELVRALIDKLKNEKELVKKILKGEKNVHTHEPMLFDVIRELPHVKERKKYQWGGKLTMMGLMISINADQVLVGPDKIILPWPFRNGETLKELSGHSGDCYHNNSSLLEISPWMRTADELVRLDTSPESKEYRKRFIEFPEPNNARDLVLEYARKRQKRNLNFPCNFEVKSKKNILLNATYINIDGENIELNVGVQGEAADREDQKPRFDKWPCGAFERNRGL